MVIPEGSVRDPKRYENVDDFRTSGEQVETWFFGVTNA